MGEPETHFTIVCETGDGGVVCVHVLKNPMIQRKRPPPIYGGSSQRWLVGASPAPCSTISFCAHVLFFVGAGVAARRHRETAIPETAAGEGGTAPLVAW